MTKQPRFWVSVVALIVAVTLVSNYNVALAETVHPQLFLAHIPAAVRMYTEAVEQYNSKRTDIRRRYLAYAAILVGATVLALMCTPPVRWNKEGEV